MIEKIWRAAQVRNLLNLQEKYNIPLEVIKAVEHIVAILDAEYGMEREVDHDDGGYVLLLLPEKDTDDAEILYHCLLEEYGIRNLAVQKRLLNWASLKTPCMHGRKRQGRDGWMLDSARTRHRRQ